MRVGAAKMAVRLATELAACVLTTGVPMLDASAQTGLHHSGTAGGIHGEGNTLRSLSRQPDARKILSLTNDTVLTCRVGLTIHGQLAMAPGDELILPGPEFPTRTVYVRGECQWDSCLIDGVFWLDVGSTATGTWRNVRIRAGQTQSYPVVYFRSSKLRWDGGLVDCFPEQGAPAINCLGTRAGYLPGSFTNTIENVTFRCHQNFLYDWPKERHDIELTFEKCVIETTGTHTARLSSGVKVADGCSSVFTFTDCVRRHDGEDAPASSMIERGEVKLAGSGCTVRFVEAGQVTQVTTDGIAEARMVAGNYLHTFASQLDELGARLSELSADPRCRGTLSFARARFDDLRVMQKTMASVGRYSAADVRFADAIIAEIRETMQTVPLALTSGSRHDPSPTPLPQPPGEPASIEDLGEGRLRARTGGSEWVYFSNPQGNAHATFLPESRVGDRPVMGGTYPSFGGPSVRYVHPGGSARMMWEYPWTTRITKAEGTVVGFETEFAASAGFLVRATWVFFGNLPQVILCNARLVPRGETGPPYPINTLRLQAYARRELGNYNGVRLWNDDPGGVRITYAPIRQHLPDSEPEFGFFFGECPAWYYTKLRRGLVVCQWNGTNDWSRNPPCGYIVRASAYEAAWTSESGGLSVVVQVTRRGPARDVDDLNHQALWFEGAGLTCWENILNLDDATNHPCEPLLSFMTDGNARLLLWERDGVDRHAEAIVLKSPYSAIESDLDWYRGDVCVTLLRDIKAGTETDVGTLPVTCEETGTGWRISNSTGWLRDLWVRLPNARRMPIALEGAPVEDVVRGDGWMAFRCDLPPGTSTVECR